MKHTTTWMLLAVLLGCRAIGFAQIDVVGSDEFGRIFDLTYDADQPDKLYALTLGNHILVSEDNGLEWEVLYAFPESATTLEGLKLMGHNKLSFYVRYSGQSTTRRSVFVLDVNTLSLSQQYTLPIPDAASANEWVKSYDIFAANPQVALVDLNYKIGISNFGKTYYTNDGGATWDLVYYTVNNLNIFINNVAISPDDAEKLFLARGQGDSDTIGGLLISADAGATWNEEIAGVTLEPLAFQSDDSNTLYVGSSIGFGSHPENLYRSTDGGTTWNAMNITWTDDILNCINAIVFNPSDTDNIIVLEENEVVVTTDGGATWTNYVHPTNNVHGYYYGLNASFNPFEEDEVYISANYHPLFSTDGGATVNWVQTPYFVSTGNMNYYEQGGETHLYYGVQFGYVHRDLNSMDEQAYEIMPLNMVSNSPGTTVFADANLSGRIYSFSGGFMGSTLRTSNDHGANTMDIYTTFSGNLHAVASLPNETDQVWASFSSFGENPELVAIDFSDSNNIQTNNIALPQQDLVTGIYFDPTNSDRVVLAIGTWVYQSTDGGQTWTDSSTGLENLAAGQDLILKMASNPLDSMQFSLATNQGIYTSTDGGNTWQLLLSGLAHNLAHSTHTNGHLIAATHNSDISTLSLHYSTDGGSSWTTVDESDLDYIAAGATVFAFYENSVDAYIGSYDLGLVKHLINLNPISVPGFAPATTARLYPNPATDSFSVALDNDSVQSLIIYNSLGQKVVATQTIDGVDISTLPAGIYMVRMETQNGHQLTEKLIKR